MWHSTQVPMSPTFPTGLPGPVMVVCKRCQGACSPDSISSSGKQIRRLQSSGNWGVLQAARVIWHAVSRTPHTVGDGALPPAPGSVSMEQPNEPAIPLEHSPTG